MKKTSILIVLSILSLLSAKSFSQTEPGLYEVASWQGFRQAAISYTFDDNCSNQLAVAIPLFNEYGFQTTMFVPSSWVKDWSGLQAAANRGHEIASHTVTHTNLASLTADQQTAEFKNSQDMINAHIKGYVCRTIAYPYCAPGNDSICASYYIAARHCQGYVESKTPSDFMKISSVVTGSVSSVQTVGDFNRKVEKADSINGWCVFLIHSIDNDGGYSPTQSAVLRSHLDYIKQHSDRFWVAPFGDVVRYIRERDAAIIRETAQSKTSITLQVSDKLENSVYNYPITIRRVLPKTWKSAIITQNGQKVKAAVLKKDGLNSIMFDVVPDQGDIIIAKK